MTNDELIKRFFAERVRGNEDSYGFHLGLNLDGPVGGVILYSKTNPYPLAVTGPKANFIISAPFVGQDGRHCDAHNMQVIAIAEHMEISFVLSPHAEAASFHRYMENKINTSLISLAQILNSHPLEIKLTFHLGYQKLMEDIYTLHDGENQLDLPKNQVKLLSAEKHQALWVWLIKDNPIEGDRELLRKMFTLSEFLGGYQEEKVEFWTSQGKTEGEIKIG